MDEHRSNAGRSVEPLRLPDGHGAGGAGARAGGTLLGLTTSEGVLVTADTRTTRGQVVRGERARKVAEIHPTAVLGATNDLGAARAFVRAVEAEADRYETSRGEPMDVTALAVVAAGELRTGDPTDGAFLLGGVDDDGPHVFTLDRQDGALETPYAAVGSGRAIAYGVLDAAGPGSLTTTEARRTAGRALRSAAERDGRTGVGVVVAEVTAEGVAISRYDSVEDLP
ncbi:MAG: proteasome subunit beta [Haloarculaceae archaeon]